MIKTKKSNIILSIVLEAIILFIAFLFWPGPKKVVQSNKIDRTKTQIIISTSRLNIRENPSVESADIGDVYDGEVYTVLSHEDSDDYYWYHIKTETGIDGYIASEREEEYVTVISGYVDRTPPEIIFDGEFIEVINEEITLDSVSCKDDYSNCGLSYDLDNPEYVLFKAVDDDGNISTKEIKYYKVYNLYSEYYDNRKDINAKFVKIKDKEDGLVINATFSNNKEIASDVKSINYVPLIEFYDEKFNKIDNIYVVYNSIDLPDSCMNNSDNSLKEEYLDTNLLKGNSICINYYFKNEANLIKYIAVGFNGVENYNNPSNYLSNYYSKMFKIDV